MIKAVLFDLDNTLLDRDVALHHFIRHQYDQFSTYFSNMGEAAYIQRFIELDAGGMVWKDAVYQAIIAEFALKNITWEILLADYVDHFPAFSVGYGGMKEVLTQLRHDGYAMGIISNGKSPFQEKNIESLGIKGFFSVLLISEKEGVKKPQPEIFYKALNALQVAAHEAVYIGDNPEADIRGAQAVGMRAIWKKNSPLSECLWADAVFEDFLQLLPIIKNL